MVRVFENLAEEEWFELGFFSLEGESSGNLVFQYVKGSCGEDGVYHFIRMQCGRIKGIRYELLQRKFCG